jgi:hypothetical protein
MNTNEYTWKIGFEHSSSRKLQTNKPVPENTFLIDLYDGHRYRVQAIYPAKPSDKEWSFLPDTVLHTFPAGSLSEPELVALRERAKYTPDETCGPLGDVVFS